MMEIKLAESTQLSAVYRFYREICEARTAAGISGFLRPRGAARICACPVTAEIALCKIEFCGL